MRRTGYTTNLAEMCREKKCHLIFATTAQLNNFKKDFEGLSALSLDQFEKIRGTDKPCYLDNSALEVILSKWEDSERKHNLLIEEHEELKRRNNQLFDEFIDLRRQVIKEQEKNIDLANQIAGIEFESKKGFFKKLIESFKSLFG